MQKDLQTKLSLTTVTQVSTPYIGSWPGKIQVFFLKKKNPENVFFSDRDLYLHTFHSQTADHSMKIDYIHENPMRIDGKTATHKRYWC